MAPGGILSRRNIVQGDIDWGDIDLGDIDLGGGVLSGGILTGGGDIVLEPKETHSNTYMYT